MSGMIRTRFVDRRPWVFNGRYYSPRGWRCPRFIWTRMGYGKSASFTLARLRKPAGSGEGTG